MEMEIKFNGKDTPVNVNLQEIEDFVKNDIKKVYGDEIPKEAIYEAFRKNPEYYLTKLYFKDEELNVFENNAILHLIVSAFFSWMLEEKPICYYVLLDGRVLDTFDTKEMAQMYARRVGGYVMDVNKQ